MNADISKVAYCWNILEVEHVMKKVSALKFAVNL